MPDEVCYFNGKPYQIIRTSGEHIRHPEINEIKTIPLIDGRQIGVHVFLVSGNPIHIHCDNYNNKREISNTIVNPVVHVISGTEIKIAVSENPVPVPVSGNVSIVSVPIGSMHNIDYTPISGSIKITANYSGFIACGIVSKN